ncbi:unnamed protein product [Gongylonema pulchrum]|uniref:Zinc finger protein n=1 Tax=Gongylonema pulchrum TaxID=637853 RepID=A0A183EVE6_9BILA|nr:unnamed protein product [Gongylonema pulchrum]
MVTDDGHGHTDAASSAAAGGNLPNPNEHRHEPASSFRIMHASSPGGADDDNIVLLFLNQLLSNLSAQGAQIQLQISRDPITQTNILHGPMADYVWGEGGLDQIVTQLLNQFEGGSTPVDAKLLPNLPMTSVEQKHVDGSVQCTTCMEIFKKRPLFETAQNS